MTFTDEIVNETVSRLLLGEDYREQVIKSINAIFLDFTTSFIKKVAEAKQGSQDLNIDWYKNNFLSEDYYKPDEIAIHAGLNKKTITNIHGSATREIVINVANNNFDYLKDILLTMEDEDAFDVLFRINYNGITAELNTAETLLVINAIATKKMQIRGGAWSAIGKRVEKPLLDRLCQSAGVPNNNINNTQFVRNRDLDFDREVDYKLIDVNGNTYRIEVKLMGRGNPESADATIARDSNIFIADTLSSQNKNQLTSRGVKYLELKNNVNILQDFKSILNELQIPHID